nr:outer membrane beta-barrel protein [Parashewanella spongiae]
MCIAPSTYAGEFYYGGNVASTNHKHFDLPEKVKINLITGQLGYQYNDYLAFESRFGFGLNKDEVESSGLRATIEHQGYLGFYTKAGYPISDSIKCCVLIS